MLGWSDWINMRCNGQEDRWYWVKIIDKYTTKNFGISFSSDQSMEI